MILGIIGGILGLLMTPIYLLLALTMLLVEALAQTTALTLIMIVFIIGPIFAILGLVGGILSRKKPQLGGLMMLVAGVFPIILGVSAFAFFSAAVEKLPSLAGGLIPFLALYFWCFILILAGAISLRGKRIIAPVALPATFR